MAGASIVSPFHEQPDAGKSVGGKDTEEPNRKDNRKEPEVVSTLFKSIFPEFRRLGTCAECHSMSISRDFSVMLIVAMLTTGRKYTVFFLTRL